DPLTTQSTPMVPPQAPRRLCCAIPGSGRESVGEVFEAAAAGVVPVVSGPVRVEPDHVERGGGEGVLEADFRQSAVAGPAHARDVQGLVDGALDSRAQGVLGLPGLGLLLGAGPDESLVRLPGAQGEHAPAQCGAGALVLEGTGAAGTDTEGDDDRVRAVL